MTPRAMAVSIGLVALSAAVQAQVTAFTYQGKLNEGGEPANGTYDLQFKLFDAVSGGSQFGSTDCVDDVDVVDGLFTVQLNENGEFGPLAFIGEERFLDIGVRADSTPGNCAAGPYTPLAPRQPVTPAPMATFALNSPGSGLWAAQGSAIVNTNTGFFVGINRANTVTSAEYFGIQAPAAGTSYGGMYIRTDSDQARPFYGYKAGNTGDVAWTYLDGATGAWHLYNGGQRITVGDTGQVGIGTTSPGQLLDVAGRTRVRQNTPATGSNTAGIWLYQQTPADDRAFVGMRNDDQVGFYGANGAGWAFVMDVATGNVGMGTTFPSARLHIATASDQVAQFSQFGDQPGVVIASFSASYPALSVNGFSNSAPALSVVGTARVDILEITGADVAEKFPLSEEVRPGMVVAIDPTNPGKLCLARGAYNRCVAGVISGANDLPAGTILGNLPGHEDSPPVALSGRVWVYCDATEQAIQPGDLLTTSHTPGHAMAVRDHPRAMGAVIGKAMTSLAQGETGLVLVLVNLQ